MTWYRRLFQWFLWGQLKCRSNILRSYEPGDEWHRLTSREVAADIRKGWHSYREHWCLHLVSVVLSWVGIVTKAIWRRTFMKHHYVPGTEPGRVFTGALSNPHNSCKGPGRIPGVQISKPGLREQSVSFPISSFRRSSRAKTNRARVKESWATSLLASTFSVRTIHCTAPCFYSVGTYRRQLQGSHRHIVDVKKLANVFPCLGKLSPNLSLLIHWLVSQRAWRPGRTEPFTADTAKGETYFRPQEPHAFLGSLVSMNPLKISQTSDDKWYLLHRFIYIGIDSVGWKLWSPQALRLLKQSFIQILIRNWFPLSKSSP